MEIRNSLESLKSLLGVNAPEQPANQGKAGAAAVGGTFSADHATLSSAASELAQSAGEDVRTDKVASIQEALANGSYNVSALALSSKMVDSMLAG